MLFIAVESIFNTELSLKRLLAKIEAVKSAEGTVLYPSVMLER